MAIEYAAPLGTTGDLARAGAVVTITSPAIAVTAGANQTIVTNGVNDYTFSGEAGGSGSGSQTPLTNDVACDGYGLTGADRYQVYVDATNSLTFQWWAVSNRFAMVQIIDEVTNVTFISP